MFSLTGKVAVVTGAGRGLGREMAQSLARAGAYVLLHGRNPDPLEDVVREIESAGGKAASLLFDLTDEAAMAKALEAAVQEHGAIDILVNNAGHRDRRGLYQLELGAVRELLEIDLVAPFELARQVARHMPDNGRIINITSIAGHVARANDPAYTAAKAGLTGLTRALAADFGPRGITVNAVAPGYFATEANADMAAKPEVADWLKQRTSLGRWGRPEEISGAVLFLASPAASYITGHVLVVDGGFLSHF
ncbi:SDR family oxidoreductase [Govanella unica]|uniref:SDR family oxidoreductase n=1 Tax=Govanella unica TaxID=2975056 RepID=A0A9X3TY37_9PROT|nr:SDR family oxidoreductase [Govania unica]MDA5193825.1 SDR family oxidoreductase [Govania unica]